MPAYGVTAEEIEQLKKKAKTDEQDAIVFVADNLENAQDALKAVAERAREAIEGVPEETRAPSPDGTTHYMRPRPGAARMYPETDIPPTQITEDYVKKSSSTLPEFPEQKLERLMKEYKLNQKLAKQIIDSDRSVLFEAIVKKSSVSPTTVAAFLTETLKALKRDGIDVDKVSEGRIEEIFRYVGTGKLTKEALQDVVIWLSKHSGATLNDAINALGLQTISENELKALIDQVIEENRRLIKERGKASFGALMGIVMKHSRGKADAALVSKTLKERLEEALH
jgi:glutamyl-tRNA(Gln) amidotransferase subunit E